jgi:ribosomal protein S12 methylthiotransferase accessory factor YcaO
MQTESFIPGKDVSLESTIATMQAKLAARGFRLDESSWLNPVEAIWSVHVKDQDCPMLFANGKGATKESALVEISKAQRRSWQLKTVVEPLLLKNLLGVP